MYHRGTRWEEYLERQGFKDDIVRGLERQTRAITTNQAQSTREIVDAEAETARILNKDFGTLIASQGEMNTVMRQGFDAVAYGFESVRGGIETLHADFNWAMGAMLWKMEMQHTTLRDILSTLQAPLDIQAKELRKRAEDAYLNSWYDEALSDFLESEQRNYQDFAVHQAIGNIYLYKQQPANLERAREYYLKAGKYAAPRSAYHAARGYLCAAFVCYLQRDDAAAMDHSRRAMELYPQLLEAFYNHAKFAAAASHPDLAIPALETAIRADREYAVKAYADADFENIAIDVTALMERLRGETRQKAESEWLPLRAEIERYAIPPSEQESLSRERAEVETLLAQDTYFGYQDVLPKIDACRKTFNCLRLSERDQLLDESRNLLTQARAEMADYVIDDALQDEFNGKLTELERLSTGFPTWSQARDIRDRASECSFQKIVPWKLAREIAILAGHTIQVNRSCLTERPAV
jgi:tetratricopeptide (TPR) repeat protein